MFSYNKINTSYNKMQHFTTSVFTTSVFTTSVFTTSVEDERPYTLHPTS